MRHVQVVTDVIVKREEGLFLKSTLLFSSELVGAQLEDAVLDGYVRLEYGCVEKGHTTITIEGEEVPVDSIHIPLAQALITTTDHRVISWNSIDTNDRRQIVTHSNNSAPGIRETLFLEFSNVSTLIRDCLAEVAVARQGTLNLYKWDGLARDAARAFEHFNTDPVVFS